MIKKSGEEPATTGPTKTIGLWAGPFIFATFILLFDLSPSRPEVTYMAAIAILMAVWWITEAVPLAITSLLPVVLFPVLGVMNGKDVSSQYFNHVIFLFLGGFMVALAMQRWNLHKRIALRIMLLFGAHPRGVLLGFMVATAFLSMWISNTATAMMMTPMALAIILNLESAVDPKRLNKFSIGILLGVAYSASIGGISTLVGTPPNLSFARILHIIFPGAPEISFANWFFFAFPISVVFLIITWVFLSMVFMPSEREMKLDAGAFRKQYDALGKPSFEEKVIFAIFISMALLWLFRADIRMGDFIVPGWSNLFPNPKFLNDGTVAIACALLLFMIPSKQSVGRIMNWETTSKLPWNIVLLFGGGFALASGFKESGLSMWLGSSLESAEVFHPIVLVASICFLLTFLTEMTSNTATAEMLLPVLGSLGVAVNINPLLLMIPGTIACSLAFMLPVATPPNAIIFGTGKIKIADMVKAGILLNVIGVVLVTTATYFLGMVIFDIDLATFPEWARVAH